ncbi:PilZ domain-containing protein [Croceicoccus naphthovorans]|uniref:Uncharacterized protein n=1 Tax=Croceicoccus naphthovorans TaxID=1348774 RepID=A0A0G3XFB0_9SPHN|nr:PilZ domain-containing protein [Croceicoccus naphthovorans]AKM10210.1 hypothetical protein AB433_09905 [Croceicoccus naphthovorans]MBB3990537.1 hypothetical protein [Croceicoccus naphthovorans]
MDSRLAERISVSARGSFRRGVGLAQTVTFADLTREGCRLIDIPRSLSRGERISLRIGNVGPIVAQVCWLRLGREAGLAFEQPLSEQVYDLLTTQARVQMQSAYRAEIMGLHNSFTPEKSAVEDPERRTTLFPFTATSNRMPTAGSTNAPPATNLRY